MRSSSASTAIGRAMWRLYETPAWQTRPVRAASSAKSGKGGVGANTKQATLANKPKPRARKAGSRGGSAASHGGSAATHGGSTAPSVPASSTSSLLSKGVGQAFVDPAAGVVGKSTSSGSRNALLFGALTFAAGTMYYTSIGGATTSAAYPPPSTNEDLVNWSGTHQCQPKRFYQPETQEHVEAIVKEAAASKSKLRCVGSGLSPNGIAFQPEGMVSLSLMDKILSVDADAMTVTVQSGARVQDVADRISEAGLTLINYASIREQTIGGFTQIGAHGTGAGIPSVDDSVVGLKMVTPALGTISISKETNPRLFELAKVGLGCLGVVTEVTLQCVPAHKLVERTFVASVKEVKRNHAKWLQTNKHLRYMWLPATDSVVVVQCNEEGSDMGEAAVRENAAAQAKRGRTGDASNPLRDLIKSTEGVELGGQDPDDLTPTECRDVLLAHDPLNASWVASVNQAEAAFWKSNEGIRVGYSDEILGFDCGGQQWVFEVAFPCGTRDKPNGWDISYMEELLKMIKKNKIPAPSPIEQRWTSGSSSSMSPCSGPTDSLHTWVGIIMYLPEEPGKEDLRDAVTSEFIGKYRRMVEQRLLARYNAVEHWAKLEIPEDPKDLQATRARLHKRYPIEAFQQARAELDPDNIFGGDAVDAFFQS